MCHPLRLSLTSALRGVLFFFLCSILPSGPSLSLAGGAAPDFHNVGMRTFGVWEPETQERFDFSVWYPSWSPASESVQEGWIVEAGKRGRIMAGAFPVVLISHDTAGGRFAHNDLATALAAGGAIVIVPTHSGDNQNSATDLYSAELLRDRPRHLLRALETVLSTPDLAPHTDESRIGLVGVGAGAVSVMQLAGAVPDFTRLDGYCASDSPADAFCARWVREKLSRLPAAMAAIEETQGESVFSPPLSLFAPELIPVPTPPENNGSEARPAQPERKPSLWQRLFEKEEDEEAGLDHSDGEAAAQDRSVSGDHQEEGAPTEAATGQEGTAQAENAMGTGIDGSGPIPGDIQSRKQEEDKEAEAEKERIEPVVPFSMDANIVYRRKPEVRGIRGIALVAPAGGMLFSRESLAGIHAPVAIIEAGQDVLYPPQRHARAYFVALPAQPLVLQLPDADHFSLFAPCAKDTLATLSQMCGRLSGDARSRVTQDRDRFLAAFFQAAMGDALPVLKPSGFAAAPHREDQGKP